MSAAIPSSSQATRLPLQNESAYRFFRLAQYDHTTNRSRVIEFYCGLCSVTGNRLRLW